MTEENHGEERVLPTEESTAAAGEYPEELERRFSEPILKGTEGVDKAQIWISAFLVVVAGVIAYSNTFALPFRAEDRELVIGNAGIQDFGRFDEALAAFPRQPVTALALGLNEWLLPSTPASFRIVGIALHALASVLVFLLCRRLFRGKASESVAMLAGLLFALHPLATESVDFLLGRGSLLATVFSLASIVLMLRATEDDARIRAGAYAGALLAFILAWGSMPAVAGLPLLVLAADWVVRDGRLTKARFVAHLGYWGLLLLLLTAHMAAFSVSAGGIEEPGLPFVARLAAVFQHLRWIAAPYDLSAYHPVPGAGAESQAMMAAVLCLVLLGAGAFLLWRRSVAGFALLWLVVTQVGWAIMARSDHGIAEHPAYLPLAGAVLLLPWALQLVPAIGQLRTIAGAAAAVLLLTAGVGTFVRNQVWQSDEALWRDAAAKYPTADEPHLRVSRALLNNGEATVAEAAQLAAQNRPEEVARRQQAAMDLLKASEEEVQKALEESPARTDALFTLAQLQEYQGRPAEALETYRKVLEQDPAHSEALWRLAALVQRQAAPGDTESLAKAVDMYRRADEAGHLPTEMLLAYGQALVSLGAAEESAEVLSRAVALSEGPAQERARAALDTVTKELQTVSALQKQVMAALQQAPNSPEAARLQGQLLGAMGHNLKASYLLNAALLRNPQDGNAWLLLGITRAHMKSAASFVQEWPVPPASPAPNTTPWRLLARSVAASGDWESAVTYLKAAAQSGELAGLSVAIAAADIAAEVGQPALAQNFLTQAAEAAPTDPLPWLRLTDLALSQNDLANARTYFAKARDRNAAPEELAKRKEKIGDVPEAGGPAILR